MALSLQPLTPGAINESAPKPSICPDVFRPDETCIVKMTVFQVADNLCEMSDKLRPATELEIQDMTLEELMHGCGWAWDDVFLTAHDRKSFRDLDRYLDSSIWNGELAGRTLQDLSENEVCARDRKELLDELSRRNEHVYVPRYSSENASCLVCHRSTHDLLIDYKDEYDTRFHEFWINIPCGHITMCHMCFYHEDRLTDERCYYCKAHVLRRHSILEKADQYCVIKHPGRSNKCTIRREIIFDTCGCFNACENCGKFLEGIDRPGMFLTGLDRPSCLKHPQYGHQKYTVVRPAMIADLPPANTT